MQTLADRYEKSERRILFLVYVLHILLITAPLGLIINALKVRQFKGLTPMDTRTHADSVRVAYEHHVWLLYSAGVFLILMMVAVGTAYSAMGLPVLVGAVMWWVYRVIKGFLTLVENHRLPVMT